VMGVESVAGGRPATVAVTTVGSTAPSCSPVKMRVWWPAVEVTATSSARRAAGPAHAKQ